MDTEGRHNAIAELHLIDLALLKGERVTRTVDSITPPDVVTAGQAVAALITEAHDAQSVSQMDTAIERINEVLAIVPGLTQMRDQLVSNRTAVLTGPRNRMEGA